MQFELLKNVTTAPTTSAAAGSGLLVDSQAPDYNGGFSVQATVVGTGAVSATVLFQVSNDNVGWVTTATMTLSGTTSDTALVNITPSWTYFRASVTAISGTSAAVTVTIGG